MNSSALFFSLLIGILVIFLAVAFIGAYYFAQRNEGQAVSQSSLRNTSLLLTQNAARYRENTNTNTAGIANTNRQSACTSIKNEVDCQARPDCMAEDLCNCFTVNARADKCDYQLQPFEKCTCEQGGFHRCIELVCPIDRP